MVFSAFFVIFFDFFMFVVKSGVKFLKKWVQEAMNFTKITQGLRKMSICGKMVVMGARIRPVFAFKN